MKVTILSSIIILALSGCVTKPNPEQTPITLSEIKAQTYTYTELKGNKGEIWRKARNYIATVYGDSKAVFNVEDEEDGVLIGKGVVDWKGGIKSLGIELFNCSSDYSIRFVAKDNKAQLQLKYVRNILECKDFKTPTRYGYKQIIKEFEIISEALEASLRDEGQLKSMYDF